MKHRRKRSAPVLAAALLISCMAVACGKAAPAGQEQQNSTTDQASINEESTSGENDMEQSTGNYNETITLHTDSSDIAFKNDLGVTDIGDPFMLRISENEYYMYCTSAPNGFYCWRSTDMIHWTDKKMCYIKQPDSWCVDCFWAPEVCEWEGRYYMFYTAKNQGGSLRIGLAISDSPAGPFTDYANKPLIDPGYAVIDANIFIDEDGSKYLYYVRDCSENVITGIHTSQIYGVKLSDDMLSIDGEAVLLTTPEQSWERASGNYVWNEGPEMLKHDGKYYLAYSANYFEDPAYSLGYAVSDSPMGPFAKADHNPILTSIGLGDVSGTGHHSFVPSPDMSQIWAAYHSHTSVKAPSGNRKVNLAEVKFDSEGRMFINGPLTCMQPAPSGSLATDISTDFKALIGDKEAGALTDSLIVSHRKGKYKTDPSLVASQAIDLSGGEGEIVISSKDASAKKISGIALYAGSSDIPEGISVRLKFSDNDYSDAYITDDTNSSVIMLSFDPVETGKITVILSSDNKDILEVSLSEIAVIAK
ncbi:glycoside hydrolase family 43 protein [Butyrivibrio sp. MC2013]|uniref:glycoside hydrolase family 43 protein n=1 Tax=Butyrivibrio sp. MC2013 TaxID=1280686 RepID=UPI0004279D8E|nr:glycoside hydrolase family 43 protein [Butyrivibrio sp. MC2013]